MKFHDSIFLAQVQWTEFYENCKQNENGWESSFLIHLSVQLFPDSVASAWDHTKILNNK